MPLYGSDARNRGARAVRRAGELLAQIEPGRGARDGKREAGDHLPLRTDAARDAGFSQHQQKQAARDAGYLLVQVKAPTPQKTKAFNRLMS